MRDRQVLPDWPDLWLPIMKGSALNDSHPAFDRDAFLAEARAIGEHPAFDQAIARWANASLDTFEGRPRDAKLVCQTARYVTLFFILHLHATADPRDPNSGASVGRVQEQMTAGGFGSMGFVKLAIRTFDRTGLIEPLPPGPDRRLRRFRPSPYLIEIGRAALTTSLETVALVRPLPLPPAVLASTPGVVENIARVTVDTYERDRFTNLEILPEITAFLQRDFGHLILSHLVRTMRPEANAFIAEAPAGDLAERFGMSRAHVRNVLAMASEMELLTVEGNAGRRICLSPDFVELCRQWVAIDLAWLLRLAIGALGHANAQRDVRS
ncbi:MAG TPA: hypothetical protein VGN80_09870 [Devosiaceae bacterium]|nr:hypothetical protein [Devosiaceae bacterium]